VGGNHITRDISVGVKLPLAAAEEVKISHGHAQSHLVEDIEMVRAESGLPGAEGERTQSFSRKYLARIIEARVAEIFSLVTSQARDSGFLSSIATGIVITGGTSQLEGIAGLARIVTRMPAREATPRGPSGAVDIPSNPVYATAVGLLLHGSEQMSERGPVHMPEPSTSTTGLWNEVLAKVKGWFKP
jgi:cell division protein FtsA